MGLELALLAKDPMRTYDHNRSPECRSIHQVPRAFKWLMCKKTRDEQMAAFKHSGKVADATILNEIDRELTLDEISQMTRAGPAKALGLANMMGGLAPGMNADVAIYNLNPAKMPTIPEEIEKAFSRALLSSRMGRLSARMVRLLTPAPRRHSGLMKAPQNKQVNRDVRGKVPPGLTL